MNAAARITTFAVSLVVLAASQNLASASTEEDLKQIGVKRGIVVLIGLAENDVQRTVELAKGSELTLYVQSSDAKQVAALRKAAAAAGQLGRQIFVQQGSPESIQIANNVADCILVAQPAQGKTQDRELLRALRPRGSAYLGSRKLTKPVPEGIDEWTHPYHGPDNNPQSSDQLARGNFNTQFIAEPKFSPMPEQTVAAGGRLYKAMGHIAHKANQNEMLNTLLCINAYNGTILWKRPLPPGFLIHRNTMIATDDALYLGDHESCKVFDAETGEVRRQITVRKEITDGPVWKWMAMRDGVLYALVGNPEIKVDTQKSARRGLGHWPWGMWKGHDYKDPRTAFGFGRTLVAVDVKTGKVIWYHRDEEFLDARGVVMNDNRIFCFSPGKFLLSVNIDDGSVVWKNQDKDLLEAIGADGRAQHYVTGYSTTCYMKCNDKYLFFAGPQRAKMVAASADDGKLLWSHPAGNLQLLLREDAIYAAGPSTTGVKLDYATGKKLGELPTRRACTRATGCADSIFYRTSGGTVRVLTGSNKAEHIAPMRPPCQDGVIVSNGHLYWGPWMCGCQLSLYGNIGLGPANDGRGRMPSQLTRVLEGNEVRENSNNVQRVEVVRPIELPRTHEVGENIKEITPLKIQLGDWPSYRGGNARSDVTETAIPAGVELAWKTDVVANELPTAPVVAGGLVFLADRTGVVQAFDTDGKQVWKTYTAGPVYYPPAVANDRVYVGSADGRVYAFAATDGRFLWSYIVGPPVIDRIPVFGQLISRWPVAGGVVVENGTVYAAAGITHYDGTFIVALDAITGELKQRNDTSGTLAHEVNGGVSMQGNLSIVNGELRFLAGGVYETARYDLKTLECLNEPKIQVTSQFRTAFYPYYPSYGKYLSLDHTCGDGSTLCHDASYEGSVFTNLALQEPLPPGQPKTKKEAARWSRRRGKQPVKNLWQDASNRRFTSFVVSEQQLLAAGHPDEAPDKAFLAAINVKDGADAWIEPIPADPVKGGIAVDHQQRIYLSLENGQLLCFEPKKE